MQATGRTTRHLITLCLTLFLTACLPDDSGDQEAEAQTGLSLRITNPGDVELIQTPDIVVNISGTASSDVDILHVMWKNDRGGQGQANGTENWITGNIVLQLGQNNITITAKDASGISSSKSIVVERENTTATGGDGDDAEPVVMYSYSPDTSNAAPLEGAAITPGPITVFLDPGSEWRSKGIAEINYRCCKGVAGPGLDEPFGATQTVATEEPWALPLDLSGYAAGGTRRIRIWAVFDDGSESVRRTFDFLIGEAGGGDNSPPLISGTPVPTATVGQQYSFRPAAQDADGDTMHFSIENMPAWATFNETSGRLFGTPTANDVGIYDAIRISVSDGAASSSLPPFSIAVEAFGNGAATVSWTIPTQRTDNTPLTDLAGFNVYYGQASGDYANKVVVNNPGIATHVVDNLSAGTWYFIVTAVDQDGLESNPSNEGMKNF